MAMNTTGASKECWDETGPVKTTGYILSGNYLSCPAGYHWGTYYCNDGQEDNSLSLATTYMGCIKNQTSTQEKKNAPFTSAKSKKTSKTNANTGTIANFLPHYSSGTKVHITNDVGQDARVVWTKSGTYSMIFDVTIQKGGSKTINIPEGRFDEYVKVGSWYSAGTNTFSSNKEYYLKYYLSIVESSFGSGLTPIPEPPFN
jgi:hypothetical protein